ncbi:MAG TPA: rhodanese-like domain-containing protein [Candidatus Saccharimonadia bacterium]|nr:rhodanese-like domain-containing protein [Candidatus Saccharimonadia bacterium]
MSYTSHDLLDAARRAIPEVSVDDVAARRTRGDDVILLDVREKEEVRAGYIEGAVTIPRGLLEFQAAAHLPQTDTETIHVKRDTQLSIAYSEELISSTISATLQSTDRHHGIVGQERCHFQLDS